MQYGTAKTVKSAERIAAGYNAATGKTLEIGDIAKQGGGKTSRHKTHQNGTDVDIRPPSKSGGPTNWRAAGYDREATRKLIQQVRKENPNARILFNDPVLIREGLTRPAKGHDNHLHVSLR
jgi:conjugal transfer mating pair stabilization protein TraG